MAKKLLIVHGYSDGSTSFTALGDFFIARQLYKPEDVFYLDYSSMDDDAIFEDFADKLDADHRTRLRGERVDVACHSTGSLVVRSWLALHAERAARRGNPEPCPVDRLLCFAPANFGSDLAKLGQSFLGKFRSTFFNSHAHGVDFMESGRRVLQGLEPASPFQWRLSMIDLHGERTYFREPDRTLPHGCYPIVLAAGTGYGGVEARVIKERAMPGTDGTVRIAGTSLNTRCCTIDFRESGAVLTWRPSPKFADIPFAVFAGFNHGSIIDPTAPGFVDPWGPGTWAVRALEDVKDAASYARLAGQFRTVDEENHQRLAPRDQGRYQQFFFKVRDDVDLDVDDFYVDFHVVGPDGRPHAELTLRFDADFAANFYRHSASGAYRMMMLDCRQLGEFGVRLREAGARLVLEITGVSKLPDVRYEVSAYDAFDPARPPAAGEPALLSENTTTLVDVVLNRRQTDRLLQVKDSRLNAIGIATAAPAPAVARTGRAVLVAPESP
jgi:hypothetical protein